MSAEPSDRRRMRPSINLGDRPEWILRILYAPTKGKYAKPIIGNTRMMKGCFLVDRKLGSKFDVRTDFQFQAADYGPLDPKVYDALEHLIDTRLITVTSSDKYNGTKYSLTPKGREKAKDLFSDLPDEQQSLVSQIKQRFLLKPLPDLLDEVYSQYPKMAENSKLVD